MRQDPLTGFDGRTYRKGDRVILDPDICLADATPPGAHCPDAVGTVVDTTLTERDRVRVEFDHIPGRLWCGPAHYFRAAVTAVRA